MSTELPESDFLSVDPQQIACERIGGIISTAVLGGLAAAALVGFGVFGWFGGYWIWMIVLALSGLIGLGIFSLVWPPIDFRNLRWRLDDTSLEICRGVLWKHQISIPLGRIQHADVSQGPIQRMFGLASLIVHTAASQYPSVTLDGLSHQQALQVRDRLVLQNQRDSDV